MAVSPTHEVTQLLKAWTAGDQKALEKLTPLVYEQLHRVAQHYMAGQRPGHTLQTTALVHEVYLRLVDCGQVNWQDRAEAPSVCNQPDANIVALDDALNALAEIDDRKSRVVELRFFGGLSVEETAEVLGVSAETVGRDWKLAKMWLLQELSEGN